MKIAVGSDHRGVEYKRLAITFLAEMGHICQDFSPDAAGPVDYPDIAGAVCGAVVRSECERGVLICGTGIGMSIAANKVRGIRAALCCDAFMAERARLHNDANVICLGAERGSGNLREILKAFFQTPFEGGRHQRRLEKVFQIEADSLFDKNC